MDGAQAPWLSVWNSFYEAIGTAWFFWVNAIVCIALFIAIVRVEKNHRRKLKKLQDALNDPAMKDMLALRLRIKDILKKHV